MALAETKMANPERPGGRENLLRTAVQSFAQRGFAESSIRDIAKAAGCSIANVYHHFENKEALLSAILETSVRTLPIRLRQATHGISVALERLEALLRAHIAVADEFLLESQIFFNDADRLSAEGNGTSRLLQREILAIYIDAVASLPAWSACDPETVRITALNMLGVVNWHLRWARPGASSTVRKAEADAMVGFVLRGADAYDTSTEITSPGRAG